MRYQAQRGTEDVLPSQVQGWLHLEKVFRDTSTKFGYLEIRTPTFEDTALFARSVGETTDIVSKEMYNFVDKGDRNVALRPEGTAGVMRAVIEHSLCPPGTVSRFSYVISIFRYERPQKGRYREAHQVGLELVGSPSPRADAEIIEATLGFYTALGLGELEISLNSIGRAECRTAFREEILRHMAGFMADQDEAFREKIEKNPLRLLDSKDSAVQAALQGLRPITDFLEPESKANFEAIQEMLTARGAKFKLTPLLVRGLDYYTDTVFEVVSGNLGSQNSLCGGGRYDGLVQLLGGSSTPSVGVAMGIERALLVLEAHELEAKAARPDVFVVSAQPEAISKCDWLAGKLRAEGLTAIVDPDGRSLKSQLRQAEKANARFAAIIGADELSKGVAQMRDLDAGKQDEVSYESVADFASAK